MNDAKTFTSLKSLVLTRGSRVVAGSIYRADNKIDAGKRFLDALPTWRKSTGDAATMRELERRLRESIEAHENTLIALELFELRRLNLEDAG